MKRLFSFVANITLAIAIAAWLCFGVLVWDVVVYYYLGFPLP